MLSQLCRRAQALLQESPAAAALLAAFTNPAFLGLLEGECEY
jgi:hypothetical protein